MNELTAAITGLGVVSPIGLGWSDFADSVEAGVSALDLHAASGALAAPVVDFNVVDHLVAEKGYLDRCSEFALAATKLCLDHAGLDRLPADEERAGLVLGTMYGCLGTMANYSERVRKRGVRFATPLLFSQSFINTPASLIAIDFRLKGYHATVSAGLNSAWAAFDTALVALAAGHADALLVGAADALTPDLLAAEPDAPTDPESYDPWAAPCGPVPAEGAAMFLLEPLARAQARGATIHALLHGEPRGEGFTLAGASLVSAPEIANPAGLYGEPAGASGALALAAAIAGLQRGVVPALRGGDEELDARREPLPTDATAADVLWCLLPDRREGVSVTLL